MIAKTLGLLLTLILLLDLHSPAQDTPAHFDTVGAKMIVPATPNAAERKPDNTERIREKGISSFEFGLDIIVLIFGILIIVLEIYLVRINKIEPENVIKFVTVTLIIIATLFLITAGYNNDQIAPAMGLLGTIAGYLLGKSNSPNPQNK